jgi:hypothetical protein
MVQIIVAHGVSWCFGTSLAPDEFKRLVLVHVQSTPATSPDPARVKRCHCPSPTIDGSDLRGNVTLNPNPMC